MGILQVMNRLTLLTGVRERARHLSLQLVPVRSGRVTDHRRGDVPRVVVSEELDVSEDVLDKRYDRCTAREQAEQRAQYLTSF